MVWTRPAYQARFHSHVPGVERAGFPCFSLFFVGDCREAAPTMGRRSEMWRKVSQWRPTTRGHEAAIGAATSCVLERAQPVPRDLDFGPEEGSQERESSENGRFRWAWRVDLRRGNHC